jgi:hypothetical protein
MGYPFTQHTVCFAPASGTAEEHLKAWAGEQCGLRAFLRLPDDFVFIGHATLIAYRALILNHQQWRILMAGQTANDALDDIKTEHMKQKLPVNVRSTEGLWATLDYQQEQITALADYIDGKRTETKVTPPTASKTPVHA